MFRRSVLGLALLLGAVLGADGNKKESIEYNPCEFECHKVFDSLFINSDIKRAKEEIDKIEGPCRYFYKWFISAYIDLNTQESIEFLYKSLYASCKIKNLSYLAYANKIERRYNIIGSPKEAIYYYREIARQVFNEFFKRRITLFSKWEFANLDKQGENKKIISFIKTLTTSGDPKAAENLLSLIKIGHVEIDKHVDFLKDLARKGNSDAMGVLGNMYYYGWGVSPSKITARHYFAEGVKSSDPECLNGLGMIYLDENNLSKGKVFLERAAAMGSQAADYNLYRMYENTSSYMSDLHLIKSAKQDGYLPAVYAYAERARIRNEFKLTTVLQYKSISLYHSSMIELEKIAIEAYTEKKNKEAFYLSLLIGDLGSKTGYINASYILKNRIHTKHTPSIIRSILKVFLKNNQDNQNITQKGNQNNHSTDSTDSTDSTSIIHSDILYALLCRRMADLDSSSASIELGHIHYCGQGVEKSLSRAFARYYAASLMKNPEGDYFVGYMYEMGEGVERDYKLAREFYYQMYRRNGSAYLLFYLLEIRILLKMHLSKVLSICAVMLSVGLGWITIPQAAMLISRRRPFRAVSSAEVVK